MINNIFIFEDEKYKNFLPLVYTRTVYDLICGMSPLIAKVVRNFPEANIHLHCREHLKNITKQNHPGIGVNNINTGAGCLLVNGRVLADMSFASKLVLDGRDRIFLSEQTEDVAALYLNTENLYKVRDMLDDVFVSKRLVHSLRTTTEITSVDVAMIENVWDLNKYNKEQITKDFEAVVPAGIVKGELDASVSVTDEYKVYVGEKTRVYAGVVLNAEKGPIYIGENCSIKPHTYIEGPVYIGNNTVVAGSTLWGGTSIGPKSYVGAELGNTIAHGYSVLERVTLRDSYLADAVDIEHGSVNRTYLSPFYQEPHIYLSGEKTETDQEYLGLYAADFSRIGPQVQIQPGSVMGICSLFEVGNDTQPKYIPSFVQQTSLNRFEELTIKEALTITEHYLKRKEIELTKADKDVLEHVHAKYPYDRKASKIIY